MNSNKIEIENMSLLELNALNIKVQNEIKNKSINSDFFTEIKGLISHEDKEKQLEIEKSLFIESTRFVSEFKKIGFSIVLHDIDRVSIINYSKDKKEDKFYGIEYNKKDGVKTEGYYISDDDLIIANNIIDSKK